MAKKSDRTDEFDLRGKNPESRDCFPPLVVHGDRTGLYLILNGVRIAKRGEPDTPQAGTWVSLEPGWRVLDEYDKRGKHRCLIVEYNGVRMQ